MAIGLSATFFLSAKTASDIHVSLAPTDKNGTRMDVYEVSQHLLIKLFQEEYFFSQHISRLLLEGGGALSQ